MAKNVEKRIVQMEFDNKNFERNANQSMSTLERLKKHLEFKGAEKGFENIKRASENLKLDTRIGGSLEKVKVGFSAMGVVGATVLSNLTTSAMKLGIKLVDALAIDPIKMGFSEYETQINAIQTILANTKFKGTTMDQITTALDELNEYADKTKYNFSQMTANIGKFTAAGVDLDKSVRAIKGLSNLAGMSGANPNQANSAMYQMSQMLSAGYMMAMDWNSLVNANMAGEQLQKAIIETARLRGVAIDQMIADKGSFKATLEEGWLTSEIFLDTLDKFSGEMTEAQLAQMGYTEEQIQGILELGRTAVAATTEVISFTQLMDTLRESMQSGWTKSWTHVLGGYDAAKDMWTGAYKALDNIIQKSADARNKIIEDWAGAGGRVAMINSFKNIFNALKNIIVPIKEAFRDLFPRKTGEQWASISKSIEKFTHSLILSKTNMENLKNTFRGIFTVIKVIIEPLKLLTGLVLKLAGGALHVIANVLLTIGGFMGKIVYNINQLITKTGLIQKLADVTKKINTFITEQAHKLADLISKWDLVTRATNLFNKALQFIKPYAKEAFDYLKEIFGKLVDKIKNIVEKIKDMNFEFKSLKELGSILKDIFVALGDRIKERFEPIGDLFKRITNSVKEMGNKGKESLGKFSDKISNTKFKFDFDIDFKAIGKTIYDGIKKGLIWVRDRISNIEFSDVADGINAGIFGAFVLGLKKFIDSLTDLNKSHLGVIGGIRSITGGIKDILTTVKNVLEEYQKSIKADVISKIAKSIALLAGAVFVLSLVNSDKLQNGVMALTTIMGALAGAFYILDKIDFDGAAKVSAVMIGLGIALTFMAGATKMLAGLDVDSMKQGIIGLIFVVGTLSVFLQSISGLDAPIKKSTGTMIGLGITLVMFSGVIAIFGKMKFTTLLQGLFGAVSVVGILGVFVISLGLLNKQKGTLEKSKGTLLSIAAVVYVMSGVVKSLGKLDIGQALTGIGLIGLMLAEIAMFTKYVDSTKAKNMDKIGKLFNQLSSSMWILSFAIKRVGELDIASAIQGMSMIVIFMEMFNRINKSASGKSFGLTNKNILVLTMAVLSLSKAVIAIGQQNMGVVIAGIMGMSGAISALGLALRIFNKNVPGATAFMLMGAGLLFIAGGVLAIVKAVKELSGIGTEFGNGLRNLAKAVDDSAPHMTNAGISLIKHFLLGILQTLPEIVVPIIQILVKTFEELLTVTDKFVDMLCTFLVSVFRGVSKHAGELVDAGIEMISKIMEAVFKHVSKSKTLGNKQFELSVIKIIALTLGLAKIKKQGKDAVISAGLMAAAFGIVAGTLWLIGKLPMNDLSKTCSDLSRIITTMTIIIRVLSKIPISGAITAIADFAIFLGGFTAILAVLGAIKQIPGVEWLIDEGSEFLSKLGSALGEFVGSIVGGIGKGITNALPGIGKNFSDFMTNIQGFVTGAKEITPESMEGVQELAKAMLLITADSLLEAVSKFLGGKTDWDKFGKDSKKLGDSLKEFVNSVSDISNDEIEKSKNACHILVALSGAVERSGGLVGLVTGDKDFSGMADVLQPMGEGLAAFVYSTAGITAENIDSAKRSMEILTTLNDSIEKSGGFDGLINGDKDFSGMADVLQPMGEGLATFAYSTAGITEEQITAAMNALGLIEKMNKVTPEGKSLWGYIAGGNTDLEGFETGLTSLGKGLAGFEQHVYGLELDSVQKSIEVLCGIKDGMLGLIDADYSGLAPLNTNLPILGDTLNSYCKKTEQVKEKSFEAGSKAMSALVAMVGQIQNVNVGQLETFVNSLNKLGNVSIQKIITGFNSGKENVAGCITDMFVTMKNKVDSGSNELSEKFTSSLNKVLDNIKSKNNAFKNAGADLIKAVKTGVDSSASILTNSFRTPLSYAISTINSYYSNFKESGRYVASGFAEGINSGAYKAVNAAAEMARQAANKVNSTLDIHSPSRVLIKSGMFAAIGLAKGLALKTKDVIHNSGIMGEGIISTIKNTISTITSMVEEGVDNTFELKPVIDFSEIQNGINQIKNDEIFKTSMQMANSINYDPEYKEIEYRKMKESLIGLVDEIKNMDNTIIVNVDQDVTLDGKKVGKVMAPHVKPEIDKIEKRNKRKGGNK